MEEIADSLVGISDYPVRRRKILRTYDFIPPKFHFILPKFYFYPLWGNFVSALTLPDFLPRSQIRRVTPCRGARECLAEGRPLCKAKRIVDLRNLEIEVRRPLAVGRFVAPSRRGKAPNDCGVRSATRSKRLPRCRRSDCDCKLHLVRPARGRPPTTFAFPSVVRGRSPSDRRLRCVGPLARSFFARKVSERLERRVAKCRGTRECLAEGRPLCKAKHRRGFNGDGRSTERHDNGSPSDRSDSSDTSDSSDLYSRLSGQKVFVPLSPLYLLWVAVMCDLVVSAASYSRVARESYL